MTREISVYDRIGFGRGTLDIYRREWLKAEGELAAARSLVAVLSSISHHEEGKGEGTLAPELQVPAVSGTMVSSKYGSV